MVRTRAWKIILLKFGILFLILHANAAHARAGSKPSDVAEVEVDNTRINKLDRKVRKLTADDQAKASYKDNEVTRKIRAEITRNDRLSTYAHNIKIITLDGVVTLRGPVRSQQERDWIVNAAQKVSGMSVIQNDLTIMK